jgi:hypothetical protein
MRTNGIVVPAPAFDDDLGFAQRVEDLAVEQLISQAGVDGMDGPCTGIGVRLQVPVEGTSQELSHAD